MNLNRPDCNEDRIEIIVSDLDFFDWPIQTPPLSPSPKMFENIHQLFGTESKVINQIQRHQSANISTQLDVLENKVFRTKSSSPYKIWADKLITNSKERLGECFEAPSKIQNKPIRNVKRFKIQQYTQRNEFGLIQCTKAEMEELWANKSTYQSFNKIQQFK